MQRVEERVPHLNLSQDLTSAIARWVRDHHLCKEVELGMRILGPEKAHVIVTSKSTTDRIRGSSEPNEAAMLELRHFDGEVEAIVRALRGEERSGRSGHRQSRCSEEGHGRSRSGRRGVEGGSRNRHHRHHHEAGGGGAGRSGSRAGAVPRSADRSPAAERARRDQRDERKSAAPPSSRGVGGNGGRGATSEKFETWLAGLDGGRGALQRYLEPLRKEFENIGDLTQTILAKPKDSSFVGKIDSSLWEALGVEALGHRLLFAKGIVALAQV